MADATYAPKVYRKQGGDELVIASGGTLTAEPGGVVAGVCRQFRASNEDTYTLTAAQSGLVYLATKGSATQVISLPAATQAGLVYTFVCGNDAGEINIDPGAATYKIVGKAISVAATKDLKNTAASNAVGDAVTIVSDGTDTWYITDMLGTWATT